MKRDHIRVVPTSEDISGRDVASTIATLHAIWDDQSISKLDKWLPTRSGSKEPINYTFHIVSMGEDEAVEMYYHVDNDEHIDTLKERLDSIYPATFSVEKVHTDIVGKLIEPIEYDRDDFLRKLEQDELYYDYRTDNRMDMTRVLSEEREPRYGEDGIEYDVRPRANLDSEMFQRNSRFLHGESLSLRINRMDRVPSDGLLNTLRRPTVASLADPDPEVVKAVLDSKRESDHGSGSGIATDGAGTTQTEYPEDAPLPLAHGDLTPDEPRTANTSYLGEAGTKIVDTVFARPPLKELTPVGIRWRAKVDQTDDWMTSLKRFSEKVYTSASSDEIEAHEGEPPLTTVIEYLTKSKQPLAVQIRFSPMENWTKAREDREDEIQQVEQRGSEWTRFFTGIFETSQPVPEHEDEYYYNQAPEPAPEEPIEPLEGSDDANRMRMLEEVQQRRSFLVNMSAFAVLGPDQQSPDSELDHRLNQLTSAFQAFNGPLYNVVGERLGGGYLADKDLNREFERFINHTVDTSNTHFWNPSKPRIDFVLDPEELANFIVVPPTHHLSVEATRGTRAQQQTQSPLPRPHSGVMDRLRGALEVGYALNQNGHPEDEPVGVPVSSLTKHYARFAATGGGKSIAAENDQLALSRNTSGPMFIVDAKGGGYLRDYMRAYRAEFGKEALEENIIYFDFPDELPGISFFDIRQAMAGGKDRQDAVQDVADQFVEILKVVFGHQRFEEAKTAGNLIRYFVKILFDKKYGREHGFNRESTDFFAYKDLEWLIARLETVANSEEYGKLPKTSNDQVEMRVHRRIENSPDSFLNSLEGVKSRLDEVFQDPRLRQIFNNTSPELSFQELLESDKQVLFDLGDLRNSSADTVTGIFMITLFTALKNHDMSTKPDDYLVNLQIDEAAKVVVSEPMREFLQEGREFRLCLGMMTQFPEQIKLEGNQTVFKNVLNNVRTTLAGNVPFDEDLAEAFSHEDMDAEEAKYRLRNMADGEWMVKTLDPGWGEGHPPPFSIRTMDIPPGHPESDDPLTAEQENEFQRIVEEIRERAANEYGVVDDREISELSVPPSVQSVVGVSENIDELIAKAIGAVQIDSGSEARAENDPVLASDVLEKVHDYYTKSAQKAKSDDSIPSLDEASDEYAPPNPTMLIETARNRSDLIDVEPDKTATDPQMILTEAGEESIQIETGDVKSSGGEGHDSMLEAIEHKFGREGFTVNVLEQDGSDMPDATAEHTALNDTLVLEAETTTPTKPPKVLENLKKAQRMDGTPVFVVKPGEDDVDVDESGHDDEYWARRVENVLADPVKKTEEDSGVIHYYVSDYLFRINDKVPAIRPVTGDKGRTKWTREDGDLVVRDGEGNEHARISSLDAAGITDVPAIDMYDEYAEKHTVQRKDQPDLEYESLDELEEEWVRIKRPAIPDEMLPNPEYDRGDYHIVILSPDNDDQPMFYRDGDTFPLAPPTQEPAETDAEAGNDSDSEATNETNSISPEDGLNEPATETDSEPASPTANDGITRDSDTDESATESDESEVEEPPEDELGGKDEGVAAFADECLVQDEDAITPITIIYPAYEAFIEEHRFEKRRKNQFSRSLKKAVEFDIETDRVEIDGTSTARYLGVGLVSQ
ncbi:primase-like DNA-binding domain-containing protein [Halococcus salsus]|uniref:primase-like DNA-binding domain-containing protein n=1 Tax=Halococcus salsus TaxID=2162894 RepID=UPI00135A4148|nr:primase-like DNA-binding domain-containing protein [Halococcus salsus]